MEVTDLLMIQKSRNIYIALAMLVLFVFSPIQPAIVQAEQIKTKAESAIIIDAETGKVLYAKNENEALPPASMSKMMIEYLVLKKINDGEISWDTELEISDYVYEISANVNFSGVGLTKGKKYTVKELYEAMAINSDNATTIALAELIAGSETKAVKLMNETAEELGLENYKFVNSTGLDNESLEGKHPEGTKADETNLLSAKAAAILAYHMITEYPEVLEVSSIPEKEFDGEMIRNWNWMLKHDTAFLKDYYYEGLDGLKTGNTELAGHAFTATAEKDGRRLITVVMKTDSVEERFNETRKLLDYGFNDFEEVELFPAGYQIADEKTVPVTKGKKSAVNVALADGISTLVEKGRAEDYQVVYELDESLLDESGALTAPVEKGDKIGVAKLQLDNEENEAYIKDGATTTVDLVATEEVAKKNWFSLALSGVGSFFKSLFTKITDLF